MSKAKRISFRVYLDKQAAEDCERWIAFAQSATLGELGIAYWACINPSWGHDLWIFERESDRPQGLLLSAKELQRVWENMSAFHGMHWFSDPRCDASRYDQAIQRAMFGEIRYA